MAEFTLDTTGGVEMLPGQDPRGFVGVLHFHDDLSPFAQGYVEAMFESADLTRWNERDPADPLRPVYRAARFSDLSPEALALILRDCEALEDFLPGPVSDDARRSFGRDVWAARQVHTYPADFPPPIPYLSDDGKVCLR